MVSMTYKTDSPNRLPGAMHHECAGRAAVSGRRKEKAAVQNGVRSASVLMGWGMEDSIETADSMRARGYGARKRTAFSISGWAGMIFFHWLPWASLASLSVVCIVLFGGKFMYYPV